MSIIKTFLFQNMNPIDVNISITSSELGFLINDIPDKSMEFKFKKICSNIGLDLPINRVKIFTQYSFVKNYYDLAFFLSILSYFKIISGDTIRNYVCFGIIQDNGWIKKSIGVFAAGYYIKDNLNYKGIICPYDNLYEINFFNSKINIVVSRNVLDLINYLNYKIIPLIHYNKTKLTIKSSSNLQIPNNKIIYIIGSINSIKDSVYNIAPNSDQIIDILIYQSIFGELKKELSLKMPIIKLDPKIIFNQIYKIYHAILFIEDISKFDTQILKIVSQKVSSQMIIASEYFDKKIFIFQDHYLIKFVPSLENHLLN